MSQGNALRRLEDLLENALEYGDQSISAGRVLLNLMGLQPLPANLVSFYSLLSRAKDEAESIRSNPKIKRYVEVVSQLQTIFVIHDPWRVAWGTFAKQIQGANITIALDSLANTYYTRKPAIFWDESFLSEVIQNLSELLDNVLESNLPKELKRYIEDRISDILQALRKTRIDGTEAIEKEAKSIIGDLAIRERSIKKEDRRNPIFKRFQANIIALVFWAAPSPYDIIGAVPDINDFWIPAVENISDVYQNIEKAIVDTDTIQEAFDNVKEIANEEPQKLLEGQEQKILPPAQEESSPCPDD